MGMFPFTLNAFDSSHISRSRPHHNYHVYLEKGSIAILAPPLGQRMEGLFVISRKNLPGIPP